MARHIYDIKFLKIELDIIKDDITTTISDLLDEIKNKKAREFASNFMNILLVL